MRKISLLFISIFSFLSFSVNAQVDKGEFRFEGVSTSDNALVQTGDNGYLVAGNLDFDGPWGTNLFLAKLDSSGNPQWSELIGDSSLDVENALIKTTDGGYAITGYTSKGAGGEDVFITKLDAVGNIQWIKTVGGVNNDWAGQLCQTIDKGFMLFGSTQSFRSGTFTDLYIVKFDSAGNLKWTKTIRDSTNSIVFQCVTPSALGGYIIVGNENPGSGTTLTYTKIDGNGNVLWRHSMAGQYIGSSGGVLTMTSIIQMKNGNYVTFGSQNNVLGLAIITDSLCTKDSVMFVPLGGGSSNVYVNGAVATNDGGFAFTGFTFTDSMFVIKADSNAHLQWYYNEPGPTYTQYHGNAIIQTKGNGYAIAGDNNIVESPGLQWYWGYLYKLDNKGYGCSYISSPISWRGPAMHTVAFPSITDSTGTGGIAVTGHFKTVTGVGPDSIICRVLGLDNITAPIGNVKIYPNPVTENLTVNISGINADRVQLTITDEVGQVLMVRNINSLNTNLLNINTALYKSGIYFISFKTDKGTLTGKFIKL